MTEGVAVRVRFPNQSGRAGLVQGRFEHLLCSARRRLEIVEGESLAQHACLVQSRQPVPDRHAYGFRYLANPMRPVLLCFPKRLALDDISYHLLHKKRIPLRSVVDQLGQLDRDLRHTHGCYQRRRSVRSKPLEGDPLDQAFPLQVVKRSLERRMRAGIHIAKCAEEQHAAIMRVPC